MFKYKFHIISCLIFLSTFIFYYNAIGQAAKYKVGFLLADLSVERWSKDRDFFLASAKEVGIEVIVANAENDQNKQIAQADEMIKSGVRAMVVVPVDAYLAAPIVEKAHKHGIKVLAYDRIIMNCDLDSYISYDNEMVGKIMAIYITIRVKKGKFVYIGGPKSDRNAYYVHQGIMDILKPYIDNNSISFVCDTFTNDWDEQEAITIINKYLETGNPTPDVIFAGNDQLAHGIIKILEQKGLDGKVMVTGQDADLPACRNLVSGKQTLTIFKPIRTLADRAILLTAGLLGAIPYNTSTTVNNGKKEVTSFLLSPVPVDKNNLKTSVIFDNFHTEEEIYK
jgi:D-xylose transport system substrate-binding protein